MSRNLILYFSRRGENYVNGDIRSLARGNTEIVAEFIRRAVGGELFQIASAKPYADDYYACVEEAKRELRAHARPELSRYLDDIGDCDNIFVCGPCWCGTYPMAIFSQLERLDFSGKRVLAVVTHEGSGMAACERDLMRVCRGARFGEGLAVHGADAAKSEETVANWARRAVR